MDTLTITKTQLEAALLSWEKEHRAGNTRTHEETDALPAEQVAAESTAHLWRLLSGEPQTIEAVLARDMTPGLREAIFPTDHMLTGSGTPRAE